MRYRRFGRSDLEVSEVGFGVWTLASDWWGRIDDPRGMLHAALDAGITFIDTAPVYGDSGVGETLLADLLKRDEARKAQDKDAVKNLMMLGRQTYLREMAARFHHGFWGEFHRAFRGAR